MTISEAEEAEECSEGEVEQREEENGAMAEEKECECPGSVAE